MRQAARLEVEKGIIQAHDKVPYSEDFSWIESAAFRDFLLSWRNLVEYYDSNFDDSITEVSIEILNIYRLWTRILTQRIMLGSTVQYYENAKSALADLEYWMDEIIGLGFAKLNFDSEINET